MRPLILVAMRSRSHAASNISYKRNPEMEESVFNWRRRGSALWRTEILIHDLVSGPVLDGVRMP